MAIPFDFVIATDSEHEKVFVEIYFKGKFVASVSQERGISDLEIEFPGLNRNEEMIIRTLPLGKFLSLVDEASEKLRQG